MINLENQLNLQDNGNHDMRRTIESELARLLEDQSDMQI
jgi:hypothetical protein